MLRVDLARESRSVQESAWWCVILGLFLYVFGGYHEEGNSVPPH